MAKSTSTSTHTTTDMQLVEYTFARWVHIDKCYEFVDACGNPAPNMKDIIHALGSETACIRALILHGQMANGLQTRHSRTNGVQGLTPLEAFKEALRIGLAAAKHQTATTVDVPTRPWERTSQSIFWLPAPLPAPRPDFPVLIPRPLTSSLWGTVNPSGTSTVSGTDLIHAPREISVVHVNPVGYVQQDLSAVWNCSEADILYRNGECTVYPRLPKMKPFVVTGLPPVHPHVLHRAQSDPKAGPFHTTARPVSSQDVKDAPMLLIWSCSHGDLFVQAPKQVPVLPPVSSFNFAYSALPSSSSSNSRSNPTSLMRYAPACQSHNPRSPPQPAPPSQPMLPSGRPHPHSRQASMAPSYVPYPDPGKLPSLSQRSILRVKIRGPTYSLAVPPTRPHTQAQPLPESAPRPAPPSLSVFQPRSPPTSKGVPPLFIPSMSVSEKSAQRSDPAPGAISSPAPGALCIPTSGHSNLSAAATSATSTPSEVILSDANGNTLCHLDNCDTRITPTSWEQHYDGAHGISEATWVAGSLCQHPVCRNAQAQAQAAARTPSKLTIGIWATYKRHVKQMHFPKGRTHPCTFPGCKAVLSRGDALLRHVESKHKVVHVARERAGKRTSMDRVSDPEEGSARKKARTMSTSPNKERAKASPRKKASGAQKKPSVSLTSPSSRKGKEVAKGDNTKENRGSSSASASSGVGSSMIRAGDEDVQMVADEDDEMTESEDEFDDEWPQGDIIEDEMDYY